jgi:ribosomal-protein-alanine N-acetyltransferase
MSLLNGRCLGVANREPPILTTVFDLEPMTQTDVPEVSRIERRCFSNPWPISAYRRELRNLGQNFYVVLRARPFGEEEPDSHAPDDEPGANDRWGRLQRWPSRHLGRRGAAMPSGPHLAGFAGMWNVYDEAHITTIGVDPVYRGRGFGEVLLMALFCEAIRRGATWVTLEVRVSNEVAQRLYMKYGMAVQMTRRRYYSDNGEDAYVMWSQSLRDPAYLQQINDLHEALQRKMSNQLDLSAQTVGRWADPE